MKFSVAFVSRCHKAPASEHTGSINGTPFAIQYICSKCGKFCLLKIKKWRKYEVQKETGGD